jgi:hypothetical protein
VHDGIPSDDSHPAECVDEEFSAKNEASEKKVRNAMSHTRLNLILYLIGLHLSCARCCSSENYDSTHVHERG